MRPTPPRARNTPARWRDAAVPPSKTPGCGSWLAVVSVLALLLCLAAPASALPLSPFANHSGEDHSKESHTGEYLEGIDLSSASLAKSDFGFVDFTNANLSGANLEKTNFSGADLTGADLTLANLSKSDFTNVDLSGADLSGANVFNTDFTGGYYDAITVFPVGFDPAAAGLTLTPEPRTAMLVMAGLLVLAVQRRRTLGRKATAA
jgi:hypothetical protein